jgi:hypothetical protein
MQSIQGGVVSRESVVMLSKMRASVLVVAATLAASVACGGTTKKSTAPVRSPTLDYPSPTQETSQGEVVGADRVAPGDKLRTGPTIGPGGPTPAEKPPGTGGGAPEKPKR